MLNLLCCFNTTSIPENFTGTLTIGTLTAGNENLADLRVTMGKGDLDQSRTFVGTTDASGNLSIEITSPIFLTAIYCFYRVTVCTNGYQALKFLVGTEEYDCALIPVITQKECNYTGGNIILAEKIISCDC